MAPRRASRSPRRPCTPRNSRRPSAASGCGPRPAGRRPRECPRGTAGSPERAFRRCPRRPGPAEWDSSPSSLHTCKCRSRHTDRRSGRAPTDRGSAYTEAPTAELPSAAPASPVPPRPWEEERPASRERRASASRPDAPAAPDSGSGSDCPAPEESKSTAETRSRNDRSFGISSKQQ